MRNIGLGEYKLKSQLMTESINSIESQDEYPDI